MTRHPQCKCELAAGEQLGSIQSIPVQVDPSMPPGTLRIVNSDGTTALTAQVWVESRGRMRRFIFHHTATSLTPSPLVNWECVQFSNGLIAVSLASGKLLEFRSLDAMKERFESSGTVAIEWLDDEV